MGRQFNVALAALLALGFSTLAAAQAPPAGNIDDRVRQQLRAPTDRERTDALMTGDADLILLRRTQLFSAHGSVDMSTTTNAYLAPSDGISDLFTQGQLGVGAATRIADKVDVFADVSATAVRYFNEAALDYNAASAVLGASIALDDYKLGAVYLPLMVFDREFGHKSLTSHRLRVSVARSFRWQGVNIEPEVHGERAITRPSDYKAWTAGVSVTATRRMSQRYPVLAYVTAGYDRRMFDDYFEAFVGSKRDDDNVSAGTGMVWRPNAWGEVKASYSFGHNGSTSDVNRYSAHTASVGLSGSLRF
jgi:hypothetical protein